MKKTLMFGVGALLSLASTVASAYLVFTTDLPVGLQEGGSFSIFLNNPAVRMDGAIQKVNIATTAGPTPAIIYESQIDNLNNAIANTVMESTAQLMRTFPTTLVIKLFCQNGANVTYTFNQAQINQSGVTPVPFVLTAPAGCGTLL